MSHSGNMFVFATSSPPLFGRRHLMSSPPLFGRKAIADLSQNGNIALLRFHKDTHSLTKLNYKIKVQVCVQFFKVGEIDTLKEQYTADVIVRSRWREPSLDGQLSEGGDITDVRKYWNPKLYIENSYGDHKEMFRYRLVFNDKGEAYMTEKRTVKGTFMENLELDDFPFDVQDLTVTVASEFPYTDVEVVEDLENHHMVNKQSFVDEQEWHLYSHTECIQRELTIDQFDPSVRRSAVSVKCRAARRPGYFVWNIFMITFLICTLSFATFSVDKWLPQNRLQLSFTLVLTAVAFKSVVNQSLPRISYLTYMDKYLLASMFMMSAVCTWHGVVTTLEGNKPLANFIEYIVLGCLAAIYVVYNIGFCILIYVFPCKKRRIMAQKDVEHNKLRREHTPSQPALRRMLTLTKTISADLPGLINS
ncbi:cys-loop ligand-gated ion channel-like isoform X3 [Biomphalaria glabrata]|uniref:Cys-loop ligand-gated ion channel-like isoform X3 n=1 Tax=Biomphalaria glabrata TaxID=6526 RepID=A0A2C9MA91_BIOGL|nr:cys-loop ligand-gated ion channel-like isoform X3 [Biomphalaria glabrata]